MKRRIFAILALLALAFCAATAAFWARSYDPDHLVRVTPRWLVWNSHDPQAIRYVCFGEDGNLWILRGPAEELRHVDGDVAEVLVMPGLRYATSRYNRDTQMAWISFWYPAGGGFLIAAYFSRKWWVARQRAKRGPGCCARCGYDLRATPDRCPECGTAVESLG